jgi:hypothetical protein
MLGVLLVGRGQAVRQRRVATAGVQTRPSGRSSDVEWYDRFTLLLATWRQLVG